MPYPSGLFMCKKGFQKYVTTDVKYIRGGHDDTLIGSRPAITAVCAYNYFEVWNNSETRGGIRGDMLGFER